MVITMTDPDLPPRSLWPDGTAVWYFVGAAFLFSASTGSILGNWGPVLSVIGFIAAAVVLVAGILVYRRERDAKDK